MREWAAYYHLSADNAGSGEKGGTTKYNYVYSGTKRNKNMGANFDGRGGPQLMLPNTGKKNFFGLGGDSGSTANYGTSTSVRKFSSSDEDEDDRPVKRAKK
ncbi:hypothetical protein ADEAN_000179500 [Angomonas deanei]|uniref:Uncharacterized protein n=1 Tax=Angomonas deanei TaxID=59799 RepID=A0A7G2C3S9_9TRYP|nr:hypothetical protein ADEAN_000179500 [Angomonas deanei]